MHWSKRNKIASERKETETLAICEFGLKPNHCPQSRCTCLTASFCNKVRLYFHRQQARRGTTDKTQEPLKGQCALLFFHCHIGLILYCVVQKVWLQLTVFSSGQIYCQTRTMEHTSHLQNRNDLLCDETKNC